MNSEELKSGNSVSLSKAADVAESAQACRYIVGVDGGGTGTRVVLCDADGAEIARGAAGPSGLAHGRDKAWQQIQLALQSAFSAAGVANVALSEVAIGCGLAGVNNVHWANEFIALNPGFGRIVVETDAYTTLLGAHAGAAGVVIALGTGSVGEVLAQDGKRREVGGWGFPVGDEASGAWLGFQAVNYAQRVMDGRLPADAFSAELFEHLGTDQAAMFNWLAAANQTRYATLAPVVIRHAAGSQVAREMMLQAGRDVQQMALALDPQQSLPVALSGGLAEMILPYIPQPLQQRIQAPVGGSAHGAMLLIKRHLQHTTHTMHQNA